MNYPTMCCEVESTKTCCEPVKEAGMAVQLEVVKKDLLETRMIMEGIITKMITAPSPDDEIPESKCMLDDLQTVSMLSDQCMGMARRIDQLLFG